MAQAPPLRAVVPPLRESRWTPEWQRKILQRELLSLSFYRRLTTADAAQQRLLERLEEEFDALVADASSCTVGQVYAVRFPPMRGRHRSLVAAVAARYSLEHTSFDQADGLRFGVVYKHPASAAAPVLRLFRRPWPPRPSDATSAAAVDVVEVVHGEPVSPAKKQPPPYTEAV